MVTFGSDRMANIRRALVEGWLAAGLDPCTELAKLRNPPARRRFAGVSADYLASRSCYTAGTSQSAFKYAVAFWADRLPGYVDEISAADIQSVISECELSASSLRAYLSTLRQVLDFAQVSPNPARAKLRLPKVEDEEINPPEADQVEVILSRVSKRLRLPLATAEQCALRVSEVQTLEWGDVDEAGCRFRLRREVTKRGKSRWVPVPNSGRWP